MKKILAAFGAISAALLMSCSSSDGGTSLAEKCENGISESCLTGATWKMEAFYSSEDGINFVAYRTISDSYTPTILTFEKGNSFQIQYSTNPRINGDGFCLGEIGGGTWDIEGSTLSLKFNADCLHSGTLQSTPTIVTLDNGDVGLNFGAKTIHPDASDNGYEIFTGVEK